MKINKKFKALIIDCDGTLVVSQRDALPTARVTEAVKKASEIIHVGIATQRHIHNAVPIIKHLGLSGPSIIAGGAQIIDSNTLKILREEVIETLDLMKVIEIMKEYKMKNDEPFLIQDSVKGDELWTEKYIPGRPTTVFMGNLELEEVEKLERQLSKIANIAVHKVIPWGGKFGVVVNAALATKQHGIFEVAKILGIETHEIIGIGDGYNDFPLLLACGYKVAMENAVDDLKAIADYVAPSVEEDGVADVINKFIL